MYLEDYVRLVVAARDTAEALRREADYVENQQHAALLRSRAEACDRRAAEMERDLPAYRFPSDPQHVASL